MNSLYINIIDKYLLYVMNLKEMHLFKILHTLQLVNKFFLNLHKHRFSDASGSKYLLDDVQTELAYSTFHRDLNIVN